MGEFLDRKVKFRYRWRGICFDGNGFFYIGWWKFWTTKENFDTGGWANIWMEKEDLDTGRGWGIVWTDFFLHRMGEFLD